MLIGKTFRFEASHVLPRHEGKCSRLHGHSWVLKVYVEGPVEPKTGFVMDFAELSRKVKLITEALDHHHLGTWEHIEMAKDWDVYWFPDDFYPTSENLLDLIGSRLFQLGINWSVLEIEETCTSHAILEKEEWLRGHSM